MQAETGCLSGLINNFPGPFKPLSPWCSLPIHCCKTLTAVAAAERSGRCLWTLKISAVSKPISSALRGCCTPRQQHSCWPLLRISPHTPHSTHVAAFLQVRDSVAIHVPCSSKKMGIEDSFAKLASMCAHEVRSVLEVKVINACRPTYSGGMGEQRSLVLGLFASGNKTCACKTEGRSNSAEGCTEQQCLRLAGAQDRPVVGEGMYVEGREACS